MFKTDLKALLKTKTFYAGIAMIITGIGLCLNDETEKGIQTIGAGITTILMRDAIQKSGSAE